MQLSGKNKFFLKTKKSYLVNMVCLKIFDNQMYVKESKVDGNGSKCKTGVNGEK